MKTSLQNLAKNFFPPLFFFAAVIAIWEGMVRWQKISPLILPSPSGIAHRAMENPTEVLSALGCTALTSTLGFLASLVVGTGLAIFFSQSSLIRRCAMPFAIAFQTVPILAIAPLIILWLGHTPKAIVFVSFLIALFPILTNTTSGLIQVSALNHDLLRLYQASRWQTLTKLQIPNALPSLVNGLKVSAGLAVLGSVVGEYIAGSLGKFRGVGYWIYDSKSVHLDKLFVYVCASTLLGLAMFAAVTIVGDRILLRWQDPNINQRR
jgi:NitT/TauT family transport system permease protein